MDTCNKDDIWYIYECPNLNSIRTPVMGDLAASGYSPANERNIGGLQARIKPWTIQIVASHASIYPKATA